MQTNQYRAHTPNASLLGFHTQGHHPPALIGAEPDARQLEAAPMPQSSPKLFLSLLTLPWPFLPMETTVKSLAHVFPLLLMDPSAFLCGQTSYGVMRHFFLGLWMTNFIFIVTHLLICWPHHTWIIINPSFEDSFPGAALLMPSSSSLCVCLHLSYLLLLLLVPHFWSSFLIITRAVVFSF